MIKKKIMDKIIKYSENDFTRKLFKMDRRTENPVLNMILKDCKDSNVFVDVGAHIGIFTCPVSKIYPHLITHAFEINRRTINDLHENIELNEIDNVIVNGVGVSNKDGFDSFCPESWPRGKISLTGGPEKIETIRLDSYFKNKEKPDVVKIDVEGTEMRVLEGMKGILDRPMKIYVEMHPYRWEPTMTTYQEIYLYLRNLGYTIYEIKDHRGVGGLRKLTINDDFEDNRMIYAVRK